MNHSTRLPTKAESRRIEAMMRLGCVSCAHQGLPAPAHQCHHILQGNRRMGHMYTLPLCLTCHRDINAIDKSVVSERELWERVQDRLHLPKLWPVSKVLPRRVA